MLKPEIGEIKINDRLVDPDMIAKGIKITIYLKNYLMNASILKILHLKN